MQPPLSCSQAKVAASQGRRYRTKCCLSSYQDVFFALQIIWNHNLALRCHDSYSNEIDSVINNICEKPIKLSFSLANDCLKACLALQTSKHQPSSPLIGVWFVTSRYGSSRHWIGSWSIDKKDQILLQVRKACGTSGITFFLLGMKCTAARHCDGGNSCWSEYNKVKHTGVEPDPQEFVTK